MNPTIKLMYFEYIISKLLKWHKEVSGTDTNDFSTLKIIKLLFFVSSAKADTSNDNSLVDTTFDKFVAMPYGHVESEVYAELKDKDGILSFYKIDNYSSTQREGANITFESDEITREIDSSIEILRNKNENLVLMAPFDLVNLSHLYYSWQRNYRIAKMHGRLKEDIPVIDIKTETKFYRY